MSELRYDPVTGRWVIIAPNRAQRPQEFAAPTERLAGECPFCEGHEGETPPEILAHRPVDAPANRGGWRVRVVPNKFPAMTPADHGPPHGPPLARQQACYGAHELIIESPRHVTLTSELSVAELAEVLLVYRDRLRALAGDERLAHAQVFKNVGAAAGASIAHLHSQIMALTVVPADVEAELTRGAEYFLRHGRCVSCDCIERELAQRVRLVAATEQFIAFTPFASRSAYECWLLPRGHQSRYEDLAEPAAQDLAAVLHAVLEAVENRLPLAAYNLLLRSVPLRRPPLPHSHWRLEIVPRLASWAGFELSTGIFVNTAAPEQAACELRSSKFPKVW